MGSQDEHLGYLHVSGSVSSIDGHIGNILASEWLDAFIHTCSTLLIAVEADVAEIGLNQSGLEIATTPSTIC